MPGCQSQGLTRRPAWNPYLMRKGLDLDPAIEETEKSRKFVINLPFVEYESNFIYLK